MGLKLSNLLELENDPTLVQLACPSTGILAWPAIRNEVFRLLLSDRLYPTAAITDLQRRFSVRQVVTSAARAAVHNVAHRTQRSDVLIVGTGAGLLPIDGRVLNRYTDLFAETLGNRAWTVEAPFGYATIGLPRSNPRMGLLGAERLWASIKMRLPISRRVRRVASALVDHTVENGREHLDWTLDQRRRTRLRELAAQRLSVYPLRARQAERLLQRVSPRLAIVEDASFGYMAVFNATARARGVHVAEFQHGMITQGHDGYNVHPTLGGSAAYRATLPIDLLTFGTWWNDQFNLPVVRQAIGNPYRSLVLADWQPDAERHAVLVLGDGIETAATLGLCRDLAAAVAPRPVIFRPHPQERSRVQALTGEPFSIDTEPDLYRSLAGAAIVVAEYSTALFEAVGLVPQVLVWDTPKSRFYLGDHPFPTFQHASEVQSVIERGSVDPAIAEAMWAPGWRERFLGYLQSLGTTA